MPLWLHALALTPAFLLVWYFNKRDLYPEPASMVWGVFGLGVIVAVPLAFVFATPGLHLVDLTRDVWSAALVEAFLIAAVPEELAKFCILYWLCFRSPEFNEPMDGVVYGASVSLGFAALENWFYVYEGGLGVAVLRAVTAVPAHAMMGVIMGFFLALAHFVPQRWPALVTLSLAVPITLHGLYDLPLMAAERLDAAGTPSPELGLAALAVLALGTGVAIALKRRVRHAQLAGHHEDAADADFGTIDRLYRRWSLARHLGGPFCLVAGGMLAWLLGATLAAMTVGMLAVALGAAADSAFGEAAELYLELTDRGDPATLAWVLTVITAGLVAGLALFALGIRWLNRADRVEEKRIVAEARPPVPGGGLP